MGITGDVGAGHTLGRYELLIPIAFGGMASVWAARDLEGDQNIVAIKLMRPELSDDPNFEKMFLDEAALISRIHHDNVARIFDLGEDEESLYLVMEWIDGEPLNLILRESKAQGGVPLTIALRVAREVCMGLHAAHELCDPAGNHVGLVHRDVSPQNLLIGYDGAIKLIDFGVAKATSNLQMTTIGQVKGKVAYMSPEQARGEPVDRRSDIFSLGIVLYQLLTTKHPFLGDSEPVTRLRVAGNTPVVPPREINPAIPRKIEALVLKALAKQRDERFSTMAEMQQALERAFPAITQVTPEELGNFMQHLVGPRGERRRVAIREAMRTARQRDGSDRPPNSSTPRGFTRDSDPRAVPAAELEAVSKAAALAAQGVAPFFPPPPPWRPPVTAPDRSRRATIIALAFTSAVAVGAAALLATSSSEMGQAHTVNSALTIREALLRTTQAVAKSVKLGDKEKQ